MQEKVSEFEERVVEIKRIAKVVKGGKRFRFSAISVVGDGKGKVGVGLGKAHEVSDAVRKATEKAKSSLISIKVVNGTIPSSTVSSCGGSEILLRPASPGTGIIACGPVRTVLELAGVKNVLTKSLGSNTVRNLLKATIQGLLSMRTKEEIAEIRGVKF